MKKVCVLFLLILILQQVVVASGLRLSFSDNSTNVIGVAPNLSSSARMYDFALEQAAIFATKLEQSFCIFRSATLEQNYEDARGVNDTVTFSVNVVAEIDLLYDYLHFIECIDAVEFKGYQIGIWDVYSDHPTASFSEFSEPIEDVLPSVRLDGGKVFATATASRTKLDLALDDAFQYALTEISKYQDINIKNMNRYVDLSSEMALLVNAENIVSDVRFSEIRMFYNAQILGAYTVEITLVKEF